MSMDIARENIIKKNLESHGVYILGSRESIIKTNK